MMKDTHNIPSLFFREIHVCGGRGGGVIFTRGGTEGAMHLLFQLEGMGSTLGHGGSTLGHAVVPRS